jgi:CxxC motif-containing protein (DUF1111 family)
MSPAPRSTRNFQQQGPERPAHPSLHRPAAARHGRRPGRRAADGQANGRQWKTPPLWGVGLIKDVNGHTRLLHDGRARGVLEAVLWHGGEAEASRERVLKMSKDERDALVKFVESL